VLIEALQIQPVTSHVTSSTDVVGWLTPATKEAYCEARGQGTEAADEHYLIACEDRYCSQVRTEHHWDMSYSAYMDLHT
jgi:hypothetical protein